MLWQKLEEPRLFGHDFSGSQQFLKLCFGDWWIFKTGCVKIPLDPSLKEFEMVSNHLRFLCWSFISLMCLKWVSLETLCAFMCKKVPKTTLGAGCKSEHNMTCLFHPTCVIHLLLVSLIDGMLIFGWQCCSPNDYAIVRKILVKVKSHVIWYAMWRKSC